jgi:hypothetical protein
MRHNEERRQWVAAGASESGIIPGGMTGSEDSEFTDSLQPFIALGNAAHMALATLWWSLRTDGVPLPAERGVIVLDGGRP